MLVLGMLLQRFEFVDYLNYELKVKEGLTIKPDGLSIQIKQRPVEPPEPHRSRSPPCHPTGKLSPRRAHSGLGRDTTRRLWCCSVPTSAPRRGLPLGSPKMGQIVATRSRWALDDHTGELPHEGALIVVCASYNGHPPDNAERFCRWITDSATPSDAGSGLAFSSSAAATWTGPRRTRPYQR